jgi:hypothetical protein
VDGDTDWHGVAGGGLAHREKITGMNNTPEMAAMLALLTIGGTLIGTLGGVWLGRYLERGNEAMKWRRDRLLDAYSEFLRAVDTAVEASWMAFGTECGTEEHNKQQRIAFEKMALRVF